MLLGCSTKKVVEHKYLATLEERLQRMELTLTTIQQQSGARSQENTLISEHFIFYDTSQKPDSSGKYPVMSEGYRETSTQKEDSVGYITNMQHSNQLQEKSDSSSDIDAFNKEEQEKCRSPAWFIVGIIFSILAILIIRYRFRF